MSCSLCCLHTPTKVPHLLLSLLYSSVISCFIWYLIAVLFQQDVYLTGSMKSVVAFFLFLLSVSVFLPVLTFFSHITMFVPAASTEIIKSCCLLLLQRVLVWS